MSSFVLITTTKIVGEQRITTVTETVDEGQPRALLHLASPEQAGVAELHHEAALKILHLVEPYIPMPF